MYSIIYARRAFAKRTASFVSLFIILTLAFTTATAPLVLADMQIFGSNARAKIHYIERSGGSHFVIYNANEDHLRFFTGYDNFIAVFNEDKIRINVTELTEDSAVAVNTELINIITEIGDANLSLEGFCHAYLDQFKSDPEAVKQSIVISFAFLAVSLASMMLALGDFIRRQERDFSALLSIGATHKKIGVILICEIIPVFIAAYMLALVLANALITGVVYTFDFYAQTQALGRIIFMSHRSLLLSLFLSGGTTAAAFLLKLNYLERIPPATLAADEDDIPRFRRDESMMNADSASGALTRVCVRRDGRQYIRLGLLTAAAVFVSLFLPVFLYSGYALSERGQINIILERYDTTGWREDFTLTEEEEEVIMAMPSSVRNVEDVEINYICDPQAIIIKDSGKTASDFQYVSLNSINDRMLELLKAGIDFDAAELKGVNTCFLPGFQKAKYKKGDIITIEANTKAADSEEHEHNEYKYSHITELTVIGFISYPSSENIFEINLSPENFRKAAIGNYSIGNINIYLDDPAESASAPRVEQYLRENGIELTVTDRFEQNSLSKKSVTPLLFLGIALCVFLYCAALLTSWITIGGYIRVRKKQIKTLAMLGADRRDLIVPYKLQAIVYALPTVVLPMLLSTFANVLLFKTIAATPTFNAVSAVIYSIVFTAGMLSYLLPAYISLGRVITEC